MDDSNFNEFENTDISANAEVYEADNSQLLEIDENKNSLLKKAGDFIAFNAFRISANAEWVGGVVVGNYAKLHFDNAELAVPFAVGAVVSGIEYAQSTVAAKRCEITNPGKSTKLKELTGIGIASWQGASVTTNYNAAAGLENTRTRRSVQSLAYGTAVGLWTSPVPGFKQAGEFVPKIIDATIQNPIKASITGVIGSMALFSMNEGLRLIRQKRNRDSTQSS